MTNYIIITKQEGIIMSGENILDTLVTFTKMFDEEVIAIAEYKTLMEINNSPEKKVPIGLS